jgi:hypothetical protein
LPLKSVQIVVLTTRHAVLTGMAANWIGSYHHAAHRLLNRLQRERQWRSTSSRAGWKSIQLP